MRIKAIGYFLILLMMPVLGFAESANPCSTCFNEKLKTLNQDRQILENNYTFCRWSERKIRWLYYEKLWQARHQMGDPLDKINREEGSDAEKELSKILQNYEDDSLKASNGFATRLRQLEDGYRKLSSCSIQKDYELCIQDSYQAVTPILFKMKELFEHIFEHEREFRQAVSTTASGKRGLYFNDALEEPSQHTDYYWRFENDWEAKRFEEDVQMMELINQLTVVFSGKFKARNCCYEEANANRELLN